MSSLRMRCLEYIANNGGMPTSEIADGIRELNVKVRSCMHDASKDGLVSFGRDDVTGMGSYSLTEKGKARVKNGHMTVNGKQAGENKEASDAREAEAMEAKAHVMSTPEHDATALLRAEFRRRIEGLESDREKQRTLLADRAERIAALEKEVAELQDCTADELVGTVAKLTQENAELRKEAADWRTQSIDLHDRLKDALSEDSICDYDLKRQPIGYAHCWKNGFIQFATEEAARADIVQSFDEMNSAAHINASQSYLCAILDTAELSVKWARS